MAAATVDLRTGLLLKHPPRPQTLSPPAKRPSPTISSNSPHAWAETLRPTSFRRSVNQWCSCQAATTTLPRLAQQLAALRKQREEVAHEVERLVRAHPLSRSRPACRESASGPLPDSWQKSRTSPARSRHISQSIRALRRSRNSRTHPFAASPRRVTAPSPSRLRHHLAHIGAKAVDLRPAQ